ncbi:ribonuclease H-like domain-containing protein [Tanacetum coccineum]
MMVQPTQDEGVDSDIPIDSNQIPSTTQPSSSRSYKKQSRRKQRKDTAVTQEETQQDDSVSTPYNDPPLSEKAKDAQVKEIADLKKRVHKLERQKKSRTTRLKRLRKVGMSRRVESSKDKDSLGDHKDASKQGRSIEDIDKDADVSLLDNTQGRSDNEEMFDTNDLHNDEVNVDMLVGEKQEHNAKEREVDTSVEDSVAPTTKSASTPVDLEKPFGPDGDLDECMLHLYISMIGFVDVSHCSKTYIMWASLWAAIKARFGGNKESKKMQKNLLKQQFETFVVGAREELDSAYDRFQNIISMLELYDAKVSCEDANLKFLRSLPSVWHVVATMIRGQPGLDELDFDDLYNNLKVYEHELKGASSSNSQSIAFMSAEIKGSTSRQSTADDKSEIITKGYAQASSSKLKETLNSSFNSDEIICSFFAQQASMPETHDDEDLLQIDDDAMEEIDIRWQVAMITARIRKFMRKTGRPIDLKPKNGITFDKSKIECFNCQKLGHFARECKFAKYQANRANGSKEKRIVPIEDSNSKALVAKDSQGEIDWTKEFDDDPVTFAMVALNGIEEDDWSIEIDADHVDLGQDGLGVFDWSEEADNAPVALALMATSSTDSSNSEVPYCSNCSKSYKKLLNDYQTERDNFQRARLEIQGYQLSLESLEVIIRTHEKNEYAWGDKYEQMEYDLKMRDWKLGEKQKEFDNVIKERDELKEKLEKWSNATLLQTEILNKQKVLSDKTCIGFGVEYSSSEESNNSSGDETLTGPLYENFKREKAYKAVPPPTGTIIPPRADVAFTGIDELAIRNKVINKQNSESSGTDHESCESNNRDDLIKNKEQIQKSVCSSYESRLDTKVCVYTFV